MRSLAFAAFVCAAFAWVPPFLDRVGVAALGFGFLALAVGGAAGRSSALRFPSLRVAPPAYLEGDLEPVPDLPLRVAPYLEHESTE